MKNFIIRCLIAALMFAFTVKADANDGGSADGKAGEAQVILQMLLDEARLNAYFHADTVPARIPLRMVKGDWYHSDMKLMKFGRAVQFITQGKGREPCFIIRKFEIKESTATVQFRYPPEGIAGEAAFSKNGNDWRLQTIAIREQ